MAEGRSTVAIVPLNGQNYGTWKVQAKLALLKEGLWGIVQALRRHLLETTQLLKPSSLDVETRLWLR